MKNNHKKLLTLIPTGSRSAISQHELANALDVSPRRVRLMILTARTDGEFICGDDSGYYIPADDEELYRWYLRARSRNKSGWKSIAPARRYLRREGYNIE